MDDNPNSKASLSVRYTNNSNPNSFATANITRSNLATIMDVDQQKQNKFKEIFDQSTIDLGRNKIFFFFVVL